jgi:hypothetical protein
VDVIANHYATYVITGRRAGAKKVPISALIGWIKSKRIQGRDSKGRFISVQSLAYAIQTAIARQGIKPRDFLTPAIERWTDEALDRLAEALGEEVDKIVQEMVYLEVRIGW